MVFPQDINICNILLRTYIRNKYAHLNQDELSTQKPKNEWSHITEKDQGQRRKQKNVLETTYTAAQVGHTEEEVSLLGAIGTEVSWLVSMRNIKSCTEISFAHDSYYPGVTDWALFLVFRIWASSSSWCHSKLLLLILLGFETYYSHKQNNYPYFPEHHSLWTILFYPFFAPDMKILKHS